MRGLPTLRLLTCKVNVLSDRALRCRRLEPADGLQAAAILRTASRWQQVASCDTVGEGKRMTARYEV